MITIWKFPLVMDTFQKVQMPKGATLLSVQPQGRGVCLWAVVDTAAPEEPRGIWIHGTGHNITEHDKHRGRYINTFQLEGGRLVFHAFEHNYV